MPTLEEALVKTERTHEFPDGTVVHIQDVPPLVLEQILNTEAGKPQPPEVEVVIAGKRRQKQRNPDDEQYRQSLQAWEAEKQKRVMRFLITKGVVDDVPEGFIDEYETYLPPGASYEEFKYLWLGSLMKDEAAITAFTETVVSQAVVTEGGLAESADYFPGDGERQPDHGLDVQETADGQDTD